jgi:DNA phosphorothioation-associated putative methyltransferase
MPDIHRSRTAIARQRLSMPARVAFDDQVITPKTSVLDYGCGRGDDVRHLTALGVAVIGWDPHFQPDPPPQPADIVLLTYVLNVVENIEERKATLRAAVRLARRCLVASIRLRWDEQSIRGADHEDGVVTSRGTFQAIYRPEEFRLWTQMVTNVRPSSPCPEVVYLFTDPRARTEHIHRRYRKPSEAADAGLDPIERLAAHLRTFGRPPRACEAPDLLEQLQATYGTTHRALAAANQLLAPGEVAIATRRRRADLVVALALEAFYGHPRFSDLPPETRADVRAFFTSYHEACRTADMLLIATGRPELVKRAVTSSRIGKLTPTALYVHISALEGLVPILRVYEGCARLVAGSPEAANILKIHHDQPAVSYLAYPDFDTDAHPRLAAGLFVHIGNQKTKWTDYRESDNRPLLHRKEEFVANDHPHADKWRRLTHRELAAGLYTNPSRIGLEKGWNDALSVAGIDIVGHRLIKRSQVAGT